MSLPPFLDATAALVWKDLLSEFRTKDTLGAGVVFALLVLVIFNFAFELRVENVEAVAPGVLWITFIFAGMLGIGRGFATERDRGTLDGILLAPIDRGALYLAKTLTNVLLMAMVEIVALPIAVALFNLRLAWTETILVVALGTVGFAGVGTLIAAITSNTRAREVMLPLLLFPLAVPVVIASVKATALALGAQPTDSIPWLQLLAGFDAILVATAFLVFEYVIED
ncbi:MAG: heme exporter protein CcmB [Chloroflexi bacterium]|nr:heme exporter protein CcmB [Chloroflexota bacterium]